VGPNVPLAPDADPGDGLLDAILIGADERPTLRDYLDERLRLAGAAIPDLPVVRGREFRLAAPAGTPLHLDDEPWPNEEPLAQHAALVVEVHPSAVSVVSGWG